MATLSTVRPTPAASSQSYCLISPTAKLIAYYRQFTDIPYALEIANVINASKSSDLILGSYKDNPAVLKWIVPYVEVRYKALLKALENAGAEQVLELASGVSFRGAVYARKHDAVYVETDLGEITSEKHELFSRDPVLNDAMTCPNLFFETVNALSPSDLKYACRHFRKDRPLTIIHEGFLPYLSLREKETVARNIHSLLKVYGGMWITPDIDVADRVWKITRENPEMFDTMIERISIMTARDIEINLFEDDRHALGFMKNAGFKASVLPLYEGTYPLSSHTDSGPLKSDFLGDLKLWVMRPVIED
jgi:O-methyltransferase involved in polyketide biosynthesis